MKTGPAERLCADCGRIVHYRRDTGRGRQGGWHWRHKRDWEALLCPSFGKYAVRAGESAHQPDCRYRVEIRCTCGAWSAQHPLGALIA